MQTPRKPQSNEGDPDRNSWKAARAFPATRDNFWGDEEALGGGKQMDEKLAPRSSRVLRPRRSLTTSPGLG